MKKLVLATLCGLSLLSATPTHAFDFSITPPRNPGLNFNIPITLFTCDPLYIPNDLPSNTRRPLTATQFTLGQVGRAAYVTWMNLINVHCRLQNIQTALGIANPPASEILEINDEAPHNALRRNHSLYQRTIDLENSIESLRAEVRQLSTYMRTQGSMNTIQEQQDTFFNYTPPAQQSNSPQETFNQSPIPLKETVPSKTVAEDQACTQECSTAKLSCIKAAGTSKAMQQCQTNETACIASCQ